MTDAPWQGLADPLIVPGCAGAAVEVVIASVCTGPLPQPLFALTVILPPELFAVAVIDVVVEVPVHPEGSVQV